MKGRYLGHLAPGDPLYGYIQEHIAPQLGFVSPGAVYRVFKFTCSQSVYLYEEEQGRVRIVVKFHENHHPAPPLLPQKTGEKEYCDLLYLHSLGFTSTRPSPSSVISSGNTAVIFLEVRQAIEFFERQ